MSKKQSKRQQIEHIPASPSTETITAPKHEHASAVSIQTVADRAGVSIATVSRVLNGNESKVSAGTRARVLAIIEELEYRPSRVGSALRSGRSRLVALMVPDPANAYNGAIATSIERELRPLGKILVFCNTQEDPQLQDDLLREMRAQLVSGIVMLGAVESPELSACLAAREPVIFVNRKLHGVDPGLFIGIDNFKAGETVASAFLDRDYHSIWLIHGPLTSTATAQRVDGFLSGLKRAASSTEVRCLPVPLSRMQESYELACRHLTLESKPRAIFCTTDEMAYGVYKRCIELNLRVPGDIHLFGFDGNPLNAFLAPWLSTIRVPYEDFGRAVTDMLSHHWKTTTPLGVDTILPFKTILAV